MKHLFTTLFVFCLSFTAAVAQEKPADKAPQEKTMSKEEKQAAKAKKEAELQEAFNTAGFTANEQQLVRTSYADRSAFGKKLKEDSSLSDEDRKAKAKEFSTTEDAKLKEKLGTEKYKAFKDAQKAQRAAAGQAK
nr:hypothetical protein [uncultured Flavobacterium sp.]